MPEYRRDMPADECAWTMVICGDLGLGIARRSQTLAGRMPEDLCRRMAERGDGEMLIDAVRPWVRAAVSTARADRELFLRCLSAGYASEGQFGAQMTVSGWLWILGRQHAVFAINSLFFVDPPLLLYSRSLLGKA